jgi:hypothetical protein
VRTLDKGTRLVVALVLMVGLPGCGGGTTTPPPVATPVPTPTTTVIFESAFPPLVAGDGAAGDFAIPNNGNVRVTMDWTFASNRMYIWIFSGTTCTDFMTFLQNGSAAGCTPLGQDIDPTTKPASISFDVAGAQNARILIVNLGPTNESGVVRITLTR